MHVDWAELRARAIDAMRQAYAPYSRFPVGAAALVDDGRIVVGCNVENASYGLGLCAECGLVSALHASGGGRLVALVCVNAAGWFLLPCGRCRQLLWEHGGPELLIATGDDQRLSMEALLPLAFDDTDLDSQQGDRSVQPAADAVPAGLAVYAGKGTVFVHPEVLAGRQAWTAYWERSAGFTGESGEPAGILEEGPVWATVGEAVAWGRVRTPRVVVVEASGDTAWAGTGERPASIDKDWT